MICQNCQTEVANDLVFCTECGSRLHQTISDAQTVIMPESVVTKATAPPIEKPKSNFKWLAIVLGIIVAIVIPLSLIITYFALNSTKPNANNKPINSSTTTNRKANNQNKTANSLVNNLNSANNWNLNDKSNNTNENTNSNVSLKASETKILDERVNIDADGHIAFPFKVGGDIKIVGEVELLDGEQYEGFVFLQEVYDEHSVDSTYKMFSFDVNQGKTAQVEQFLPKGNYVLVFSNSDGKGASLKAKFTQIQQSSNWKN